MRTVRTTAAGTFVAPGPDEFKYSPCGSPLLLTAVGTARRPRHAEARPARVPFTLNLVARDNTRADRAAVERLGCVSVGSCLGASLLPVHAVGNPWWGRPRSSNGRRKLVERPRRTRAPSPRSVPEQPRERFQAREVVARRELVDVRQRRAHAARERLVGRIALQRVQPDDAVGEPRRGGRPARRAAPGSPVSRPSERSRRPRRGRGRGGRGRRGTPSATRRSACRRRGRARPRPRGASASSARRRRQRPRQAGQPRAEAERLPAAVRADGGVGEEDEGARPVAHRARDVEQQHDAALADAARAPGALDRLAAGAQRAAQRPPQVGRPAPRRCEAAGTAERASRSGGGPSARPAPPAPRACTRRSSSRAAARPRSRARARPAARARR